VYLEYKNLVVVKSGYIRTQSIAEEFVEHNYVITVVKEYEVNKEQPNLDTTWISVNTRLPEKSDSMCAFIERYNNGIIGNKWITNVDDVGWADDKDGYHKRITDIKFTHWLSLPETQ